MNIKIVFFLLLQIFSLGFEAKASPHDIEPTVCIVSLMPEVDEVIDRRLSGLKNRFWRNANSQNYHFISNLVGIRSVYGALNDCLEGSYREVFILAHSAEIIDGYPGIVFPKEINEDSYELDFLNDNFFENLNISRPLKQITFVGCKSSDVMDNYTKFSDLVERHGVNVRYAPESNFLNWFHRTDGARDALDLPLMVGEAIQPIGDKQIYCLLYRKEIIGEKSYFSCKNGRYTLEVSANIRLPRSFKWLIFELQPSGDYVLKFANPGSLYARPGINMYNRNLVLTRNGSTWNLGDSYTLYSAE